jgi:uncharacterized protein YndB with AHSA1/START domain
MATQAAVVSTELATSLESAWKALTNTDVLGTAFFGSKVETSWKVGSPILFRGVWKGKPYEDKGEVLAFSPPKQLKFSHWSPLSGVPDAPENYHVVTFELLAGPKTTVRLTQENQNDKPVEEAQKQELAKNWGTILETFKRTAEKTYGRRSD